MATGCKQSDEEIIQFLTSSGYDESIIKKALARTSSRDTDDIVDVILEMEKQPQEVKVIRKNDEPKVDRAEANKVLEDNKKAILADRQYREELIRRYQEEKKSRSIEKREVEPEEKVVEIKSDCVFNIRFPDSKSVKLCFMKEDTLEDLFKKIEGIYGNSSFTLFKMRDSELIVRSTEQLQNVKKLYPKAALYIE